MKHFHASFLNTCTCILWQQQMAFLCSEVLISQVFNLYCFLAYISSHFQVSLLNKSRMHCHAVNCHTVFTHMEHVKFWWMTFHNLRRVFVCVCVLCCVVEVGVREQTWVKIWLTHSLPCSEQWPKPHTHSAMTNEINRCQKFWHGYQEYGLFRLEDWN